MVMCLKMGRPPASAGVQHESFTTYDTKSVCLLAIGMDTRRWQKGMKEEGEDSATLRAKGD